MEEEHQREAGSGSPPPVARPGPGRRWAAPPPSLEREALERPRGLQAELLRGNFADLERVDRWLGGAWLTQRGLDRLTRGWPPGRPLLLLEVGAGDGSSAVRLDGWARRRGLRLRHLVSDLRPGFLLLGRALPERLAADGRALPLAAESVDVSLCSLTLHHLDPGQAPALLAEMWRVCRRGIVVNDLLRAWPAYLGARLYARLATRNPLTRRDAPLSVLRAFTRAELIGLARQVGLQGVRLSAIPGYRLVLTAERR